MSNAQGKKDLLQITVKIQVAFYALRESLEGICVRVPHALRRIDALSAHAITHTVKLRENLLTSHTDMRNHLFLAVKPITHNF